MKAISKRQQREISGGCHYSVFVGYNINGRIGIQRKQCSIAMLRFPMVHDHTAYFYYPYNGRATFSCNRNP